MSKRENPAKPRPGRDGAHGKSRPPGGHKPRVAPSGGAYWLFGTHAVHAALANPKRTIHRLLATPEASKGLVGKTRLAVEITDRADIDQMLAPGAVHQGLAALAAPLPQITIEDVVRAAEGVDPAVVVVLDQVTDPHNVGAILRSAAAFGALAVIVPDRHSPDETGTLAKSASGALEAIELVRVTNVVRTLEELKQAGFWTAGLAADAPKTIAAQALTGRTALVLGAEGDGLRRLTREHCDFLVKLPMSGKVESLNVSNAAAVALYELIRTT